jgi:hypothetical protein
VPGAHDEELAILTTGFNLSLKGCTLGPFVYWPERWTGAMAFAYKTTKQKGFVNTVYLLVNLGLPSVPGALEFVRLGGAGAGTSTSVYTRAGHVTEVENVCSDLMVEAILHAASCGGASDKHALVELADIFLADCVGIVEPCIKEFNASSSARAAMDEGVGMEAWRLRMFKALEIVVKVSTARPLGDGTRFSVEYDDAATPADMTVDLFQRYSNHRRLAIIYLGEQERLQRLAYSIDVRSEAVHTK